MNHILFTAKSLFAASFIGLLGFAQIAAAQDIVPPNTITTQAAENTSQTDENTPQTQNIAVSETAKPEKSEIARQMLAFFDGMMAAVEAKTGDCEAMSQALQTYYHEHHAWISSLDYATGNLDAESIAEIHDKAVAFGKRLSTCYDQKSIPSLLHRYAGMGEEFE